MVIERDPAAMVRAITDGDVDRVRELLAADPTLAGSRDADGISAVLHARYRDAEDILAQLLAAGPELDVFEAAAIGDGDRAGRLLDADPELIGAFSPDGYTPLHLAAFFGHAPVVSELVGRGADLRAVARNPMAVTPLHSAAAAGQVEVARILIEAGAPVDERQAGGWTPLHSAAQNGDVELVRLLLASGADPSLANDAGKTPADLAAERGHDDLLAALGDA
jgi:ankyrin repeat protein